MMVEFEKNDREVVRVSVEEFKGRHLLNIRTWYHATDGMRPGKAGIAIKAEKLPELIHALHDVMESAEYRDAVGAA